MKLTSLVLGTIAVLIPFAASAQPQCAPRPVVIERLATAFGESRQSVGLAQGNRVIEVFASSDTGTWTITVTLPDGTTCLVAAGIAFETVADALPPAGTPS